MLDRIVTQEQDDATKVAQTVDEIYEYLRSKNLDTALAMAALLGEIRLIAEAQIMFQPETKQDTYTFLKDRMNIILKHIRLLNPSIKPSN